MAARLLRRQGWIAVDSCCHRGRGNTGMMSSLDRSNIVEFIADIFERRGAESYLGEPVTMSQHMLQGAQLAEREGAPEELVAAALLHDIGHYTSEFGPMSLGDSHNNFHDEA